MNRSSASLPVAFLSIAVCLSGLGVTTNACAYQPDAPKVPLVNNADLVPRFKPDHEVAVEGMSPDWVKTLIMAECRIETATPDGTFASATRMLDHYAEMGVNGLWINPIYERGSKGNGYGNFGPHTIEPLLTGASDVEASFQAVNRFVEEAHRRNIRVVFDIVVWGTAKRASLLTEHPEFYRRVNGDFVSVWGGFAFDWSRSDLKTWFKQRAIEFIEKTGADGFRVDLAPDTSGYFFKEVRDDLYAKGRKILVISEMNSRRSDTFDFEQVGVHGWTEEPDYVTPGKFAEQQRRFGKHFDYLFQHNIVDVIQTGVGLGKATLQHAGDGGVDRFYTSNLLHHDDSQPFVKGNRVHMAYSSILAPFIPMWWIGEEWDNPQVPLPDSDGVMYFNTIDWGLLERPQHRSFLEETKRLIRIRRSFPDVFEVFPDNHREANIAKLDTRCDDLPNPLQAYARFGNGKAILVVPNFDSQHLKTFTVSPDFASLCLDPKVDHTLKNLMTGAVIRSKYRAERAGFAAEIGGEHLGVFLIEAE